MKDERAKAGITIEIRDDSPVRVAEQTFKGVIRMPCKSIELSCPECKEYIATFVLSGSEIIMHIDPSLCEHFKDKIKGAGKSFAIDSLSIFHAIQEIIENPKEWS